MYLKRIEVSGFKSFANRMNLDFTDGITCIVGPNGSGKSNVADAVRWVLGEQSAKQLRGSNMQDVIFSGTENRKPQGMAYVAITMDNRDRSLAVDCDEVTVSRRVYRSGESEYMMNGAACRLRDIQELFYDTGIGKEGYSIIGQGQIDRIVSGRPEERRELLDEAAGIVKFKKRKAYTIKKLENEEANLVRVSDILSELEKQVGPLEKQAEKAREYLRLRDELRSNDVRHFFLESEANEKRIAETEKNSEIVRSQLAEARNTADQWKERYEEMIRAAEELNRQIDERRDQITQAGIQKENLEGQIKLLEEQIHSEKINDEHYGSRMRSILEQLHAHEEERGGFETQKEEIGKELADRTGRQNEKDGQVKGLDEEIRRLETEVEQKKQGIIDTLNEKADVGIRMQRYNTLLEQASSRQAQIHAQLLRIKSEMETWQNALEEQKKAREALEKRLAEINEEGTQAAQALAGQERKVAGLRQELTEAERRTQGFAARLESLKNIAERYEGYGNSVRRVMEVKDRHPDIVGVVADLLQSDRKYETAIETALGGSIQNVVTRTEACAKDLIAYLKKNKYGRATFLPLESIRSSGEFRERGALSEPGAIGLADSLVRVKEGCEPLARYLLGRVLVVDHIDHALAIARKYHYSLRMVTLEGELLSAGGSLTGGAFKNSSNLLGRKREIDELTRELTDSQRLRDELKEKLAAAAAEETARREDIARLTQEAGECRLQINTAAMSEKQAQDKYGEMAGSDGELKKEAASLEGQRAQIEVSRTELEKEAASLEERNLESEETVQSHTGRLAQLKQEREAAAAELSELKISVGELTSRDRFLTENIARLDREAEALREENVSLEEGVRRSRESVAQKQEQIAKTREGLAELAASCAVWNQEAAALTERKEREAAGQKEFIDKREALLEEVNRLDKESFRLDGQMEKLAEQKESLINYLWNEYELTPVAARAFDQAEEESPSKIRDHIQELKKTIRALGDVNVGAIEEYRDVNERYTFLKGQHEDLTEAKQSLEKIIEELDEGMRRQFTEKFKEIQREFNTVFRELFGGGQGTLSLLEDEDILTAGVQINAQPPGKKLQNMMQLSGGEKALTAISLLFAIQNLKPSPFCLLDEIEAALDDINVDRFASYLGKLTDHTQFILISHRRGTMLRADRLYGITMQEKGVSTLVSVNLTEEEETKEKTMQQKGEGA